MSFSEQDFLDAAHWSAGQMEHVCEIAFDAVSDLVCILDTEYRILRANRAMAERLGVSPEALRGQRCHCCVHGGDCPPRGCPYADVLKGAGSQTKVVEGGLLGAWIAVTVSPILCPSGRVCGAVHVARDISEEKRREKLIQARLQLWDFVPEGSATEVLRETLDLAEALTGSKIGFLHFVEADQCSLSLQVWSTNTTRDMCKMEGQGMHYPIEDAGVWVDAVRQRRAVAHNDYASLPHRRGLPAGHAPVIRELVVPIVRRGLVVAVLGVGNKPTDYDARDMDMVSQLADMAWNVYVKLRAEESLRHRTVELQNEVVLRRKVEGDLRTAMDRISAMSRRVRRENVILRQEIDQYAPKAELVGDSPAIRAVLDAIEQVACTDSTVLLLGETGTGKEVAAHLIHDASPRSSRRMVVLNCAALPSALVEAELFGSEKGAYTGAVARRIGRFETADGSTLFLDEVDSLSAEIQAKLLRVLESGEFERLGGNETLRVDVRVIAASNRNLADRVRVGALREDLFYRLNVFPIHLPPLRERTSDVPLLLKYFAETLCGAEAVDIEIPEEVQFNLQRYHWPGNVRELRNLVERASILARGGASLAWDPLMEAGRSAIPTAMPVQHSADAKGTGANHGSPEQAERSRILKVLEKTGWRIRGPGGAAALLGLKPTTLESRLVKMGIKRPTRG